MKRVIEELKRMRDSELHQIGMTPHTSFEGTQEQHDELHRERAAEYERAAKILEKIEKQLGTEVSHESNVRPTITEFMGEWFDLKKAHKVFVNNSLWGYVQALDAYADDLEMKLSEQQSKDKLCRDWVWVANEYPEPKDEQYTVLDKYGNIEDDVLFGCSGAMGEPYSFFDGKNVKAEDIVAYSKRIDPNKQPETKASHISDVSNRRELLLDFAKYSENDKTSEHLDELVDNYLDSIKQLK